MVIRAEVRAVPAFAIPAFCAQTHTEAPSRDLKEAAQIVAHCVAHSLGLHCWRRQTRCQTFPIKKSANGIRMATVLISGTGVRKTMTFLNDIEISNVKHDFK